MCDSVTLLYVERLSDHLTSLHTWKDFLFDCLDPLLVAVSLTRGGRYVEKFPVTSLGAICGNFSCWIVKANVERFPVMGI